VFLNLTNDDKNDIHTMIQFSTVNQLKYNILQFAQNKLDILKVRSLITLTENCTMFAAVVHKICYETLKRLKVETNYQLR